MSIFVRDGDFKEYFKNAPVTSVVILLNIFMLLVTLIFGGFNGFTLLRLGALYAPLVKAGEYWRLLTSMFLHGSFVHLLGNAIIGLYVLSAALERIIGSKKFAFIYFFSGLGAGLLVTFTSNALTIGASGAIFGALGSLLYIGIYRKDLMSAQDFQSIKGLVIINIIFTFLMANISIAGHVGGILSGFLISYIMIRRNVIQVYDSNFQNVNNHSDFDDYEDNDPWES